MRAGHHQAGTALLSVLLMTALMGVLVVAMLDDIRFGVRRTGNAEALAQARRVAMGVEVLARRRAPDLAQDRSAAWSGRVMAWPLEHGFVRGQLRDGSTCFNLNSVVEGAPSQWQRRELGVRQYTALLAALDIPTARAQALADALADWIDSDGVRAPLGAEDSSYSAGGAGHLTAATLLAEPSELRAIHGYTPETYARIRPWVCALPAATLSPVNVNALAPRQAPLLSMLSLGALPPARARAVLAARPAGGWNTPTEFWAVPAMAQAMLPNEVYDQIALRSRWFALEAQVEHAGAQASLSALFELDAGQAGTPGDTRHTRLAHRRWTTRE